MEEMNMSTQVLIVIGVVLVVLVILSFIRKLTKIAITAVIVIFAVALVSNLLMNGKDLSKMTLDDWKTASIEQFSKYKTEIEKDPKVIEIQAKMDKAAKELAGKAKEEALKALKAELDKQVKTIANEAEKKAGLK
jgi:uncharacterized membrane protein YfhO